MREEASSQTKHDDEFKHGGMTVVSFVTSFNTREERRKGRGGRGESQHTALLPIVLPIVASAYESGERTAEKVWRSALCPAVQRRRRCVDPQLTV